jgi:exodeoxyribonuclease V beta subunit
LLGDELDRPQDLATVVPCAVGEAGTMDREAALPASAIIPPDLSLAPFAPPSDLDVIKNTRNGFRMTSYSAVKRARDGLAKSIDSSHASHRDEFRAAGGEAQAGNKDGLPGGADIGIFLHDLLATVALPELADVPDFEAWVARPEVSAWLARTCRRHGQAPSHAVPAARLIHTAYTAPTRLGRGPAAVLAQVQPCLREMEFLYPMPEAAHRLLAQPLFRPRWTIGRGVVRGFVDFLFEADGKVFICDWKSDTLPSYAPTALATHCRDSYDVQAILYILATLRMLGIADARDYEARMGGLIFCFLRARRPGDDRAGIHFQRPSWDELLGHESEMLGARFWGGGA